MSQSEQAIPFKNTKKSLEWIQLYKPTQLKRE